MRTAVNLFIKTETAREYLQNVTNLYDDLEKKMPEKLPHEFKTALSDVIKVHQSLGVSGSSYNYYMEAIARNWAILEAYSRKYLDYSMEVELLKAYTRITHFRPDSLDEPQKKKYAEFEEKYRKADKANDQKALNEARIGLFEISFDALPSPGFKGKAPDERRKLILDWYGQTFLALAMTKDVNGLPQPFYDDYSTVNPVDTNITGREFVKGKINFIDLPEAVKALLEKESRIYRQSGNKLENESPELMNASYERNIYLIGQVGISLDEYCGFMLDILTSLTLPEKKEGFDYHYRTSRPKAEENIIDKKKKATLNEWSKNGIPEFKYLGVAELYLADEPEMPLPIKKSMNK